jgi:hypothetical protein
MQNRQRHELKRASDRRRRGRRASFGPIDQQATAVLDQQIAGGDVSVQDAEFRPCFIHAFNGIMQSLADRVDRHC